MKILSVFEQPSRDSHTYVVAVGYVGNDIACYRSNEYTLQNGGTPERIAESGTKLSQREFEKTLGAWDYKSDGFFYRA